MSARSAWNRPVWGFAFVVVALVVFGLVRRYASDGPWPVSAGTRVAIDANDAFEVLAAKDPLSALRQALNECQQQVVDYACTFKKQERITGTLGPAETIRVKCRERPFSVLMEWIENPNRCERLLYVKGKWKSKHGREEAWVDPRGAALNALLGPRGGVRYEIHKAVAEGKALQSVDTFGFVNMLRLVVDDSTRAARHDALRLTYAGRRQLNGRPTYLFERVFPLTGQGGGNPNRVLLVHLDCELRVPVGLFAYSDTAGQTLLASYVMDDLRINPGLPDRVFSKEANGF